MLLSVPRDHYAISLLFLIVVGFFGYATWEGYQRTVLLSQQIALLEHNLDVTSSILEQSISETHASLANELKQERDNVSVIQSTLGNFQQEVGTISSTVTSLEKLSELDPELLQKYSKIFFLSEHYAPERLAAIDKTYLYYETRPESIHAEVYPYLKNLLKAAGAAGETIYVRSAYRSFDEQASLKSGYTVTYGSGANAFSADQGYSEHQLGTTLDFITTGLGGQLDGFDGTAEYQWLLKNAYKYGFVLSYPQGNQYYVFEPWHWRFVGVKLATYLHNIGKNFYDIDQREIDQYLINIFD